MTWLDFGDYRSGSRLAVEVAKASSASNFIF